MAAAVAQARLIESYYELETASPGRRLGGYALDVLLTIVTLFIGWLIWFIIVAPRGQTPGKQLLGMYVMREDGSRAGGWYMWLREFVVKGLVFGVLIATITGGLAWVVAALWCLWDRERQCLWDKVHRNLRRALAAGLPAGDGERAALPGYGAAWGHARAGVDRYAKAGGAAGRGSSHAGRGQRHGRAAGELKALHDDGVLTDEEYEERRARLVDDL